MHFQSISQLHDGGKSYINLSLFNFSNFAVIYTTGIGKLPEAEPLCLPEPFDVFTELL